MAVGGGRGGPLAPWLWPPEDPCFSRCGTSLEASPQGPLRGFLPDSKGRLLV